MFNLQIIPVSAFQQNCSIIWDDNKNAAIIDAGDSADKIIQFVELQNLKVRKLLLTHGHLDHIMAVEKVRDHFGVEVYGSHIDDKPLFEQLPQMCEMFGLPPVKAFLPDHWLNEGDVVEVGALRFSVRHLPGHAPGHIGFFDFENKIAFSGDVLFKDSIGRTDLYLGSLDVLLDTIRTKMFDLYDDFIVVAGHGPHTTIGREKLHNPFLK
ncbi:glyoxalase II family protein [Actinobacillus ureae]|uniref:Metallo-beta-lactamase domain protein n=1 Tax=Actinobacillus ureae ATCC 25976 TaxID=887324 RepID=E8KJ36_9PAST|nr:MBL fold metallo-hydrolase [Actinobacillus ureae]EFX91082.1 metallo-beta-lactamase domain protein [Actinobacillus ureae ATCC 25976]SUT86944.1 glyoxalase II family protein [Actinobacillus ureae]SUU47516.1 glyoxalase II family protein [Actinobacillus ureae]